MPLTLKSLTVSHEETAILRVALAALEARPDILSPEARALLTTGTQSEGSTITPLASRLDNLLNRFAGHPGVITQAEADHRDRMVEALTPKVDPGNGHTHGHSLNLCYIVHEEA